MKTSQKIVNGLFLAFGIFCILYYLGMGFAVRFGQSLLFLWPTVGVVCLLRYFLWRRAWKQGKAAPFSRRVLLPVRIVVILAVAVFLLGEAAIVSRAFRTPPPDLDAIVVLGARVNEDGPSGSLWERICTARDYLRDNPDTVCVCSGGQGSDEPMSEGECTCSYLLEFGIPEDRLLVENTSTSTTENLQNSFALLALSGREIKTVGILTNDFHVFRAVAIARHLGGYTMYGVPAPSSAFGFLHYAMREFAGVAVGLLRGDMTLA